MLRQKILKKMKPKRPPGVYAQFVTDELKNRPEGESMVDGIKAVLYLLTSGCGSVENRSGKQEAEVQATHYVPAPSLPRSLGHVPKRILAPPSRRVCLQLLYAGCFPDYEGQSRG